ncbi:ATP synthase F1 subunit epsilon [Mycoplasmopsis glycophila]|uniref:ATP synthase epsilon chain n=1 Tax=Mycoplasmopsis glycophila TaxID=171285 RepID=A0A449AV01_9BACT|nr:ATP synthase F1 subunit epsilon [Mycoplasmopsis glycophila]VEU70318.1 ATP synthase epsilon subunit [Mycoplasmopsis glycophila]
MSKVKLTITTPNGIFYEGETEIVSLKTALGYIGLQAHRTPLFSNIEIGKLVIGYESDPNSIKCSIGGGIVYADSEKVNIITEDIIDARNIDLARAQKDRDLIMAQLSSAKKDNIDLSKLEVKLKKTLSRIDTYNQFNK